MPRSTRSGRGGCALGAAVLTWIGPVGLVLPAIAVGVIWWRHG